MENRRYITLLSTENYLIGVLTLKKCLDMVKAKYGLTVLVTENISSKIIDILQDNDVEVIKIKAIDLPEWIKNKNKENPAWEHWSHTFDKLRMFELTQYDKIVYLDSDMYIRNNIDELFDMPHLSAVVDRHIGIEIKESYQKLTSGTLVVKPEENVLPKFLDIMNDDRLKHNKNNIGDQDVIQLYDEEWENKKELHLSPKYNMFFIGIDYYVNKGFLTLDEISIIHFTKIKKPWDFKKESLAKDYLDWIIEQLRIGYEKNKLEDERENIEFGHKNRKIIIEEYSKILLQCMDIIEKYKE